MVQKYFKNSKKHYSINEKAIKKWSFKGRGDAYWAFDDKKSFINFFKRIFSHEEPVSKWSFNDSSKMSSL